MRVTRVVAGRNGIDAKHVSLSEKPQVERLLHMSLKTLYRTIKVRKMPRSGVICAERSGIVRLNKTITEHGAS